MTNEEYKRHLWNAIKAGRVTLDQLAAVDEATAKMLCNSTVLLAAKKWATEVLVATKKPARKKARIPHNKPVTP